RRRIFGASLDRFADERVNRAEILVIPECHGTGVRFAGGRLEGDGSLSVEVSPPPYTSGDMSMSTITTKDGTTIYYKDWVTVPRVTFSNGWPLNADALNGQMLFLAQNGFRVVAHGRRGHGRSSQPSSGNDMNGYADDLAAVIEALNLTGITAIGHS